MWNFNKIIELQYIDGYVYYIKFDNGVNKKLDFSEYLSRGGVFDVFKNKDLFKQAKIDGGTIAWSNGLDIAPETIYNKCYADKT
jgi:hypothetical protein